MVVKAAGYRGMIGGQMIDLECETREVDIAAVEYMHIHKTGALLSVSLELGALLGGGVGRAKDCSKTLRPPFWPGVPDH